MNATAINYTQGSTPSAAYDEWKANWQTVKSPVLALYGRCVVEFAPYAHKSDAGIWTPERASYQAIVVDDSTGELAPGTEVALMSLEGQFFEHEGRRLCAVEKEGILAILTDE